MGLYAIVYFLFLFVSKVSKGQSTSAALCSTCSAAHTCTGCNVNADVLTMSNTSWYYGNPAVGTPYVNVYLVFTAYSITTASSVSGNCVTRTGSRIPLIDAYTANIYTSQIPFSTSIPEKSLESLNSESSSDASSYSQEYYDTILFPAYSSVFSVEGLEGCTATPPPSQAWPTFGVVSATTENSTSGHHARRTRTIILSVIIPIVGLMTPLLCFVIIRRYRKNRSHAALAVDPKATSDTQLYLDRKAELEDEERRRHELDAGGKVHEMDGQDTIFEMPGDNKSRMDLASPHKMQELRGLDHSQELEVPSNV